MLAAQPVSIQKVAVELGLLQFSMSTSNRVETNTFVHLAHPQSAKKSLNPGSKSLLSPLPLPGASGFLSLDTSGSTRTLACHQLSPKTIVGSIVLDIETTEIDQIGVSWRVPRRRIC